MVSDCVSTQGKVVKKEELSKKQQFFAVKGREFGSYSGRIVIFIFASLKRQ